MIRLTLPLPPSTNGLFANVPGRGRVKTQAYRDWIDEAGWLVQLGTRPPSPSAVRGFYRMSVTVPHTMRGDLDNRIKALSDLLVKHGVTDDDRNASAITVRRGETPSARECVVIITPEGAP